MPNADRHTTERERGRMELDFERDPAVLAVLGDALGWGVFTVDAAGRFVSWSAAAEAITGFAAREVRGQPCRILEGPNCKGFRGLSELLAAASANRGASTSEGLRHQECRVRAKDQRELHLLGSVQLLRDDEETVYGAIGAFADISASLSLNAPAPGSLAARGLRGLEGVPGLPGLPGLMGLLGESAPMAEVFRRIRLASDSDVTTLITGESGTGKELAARAIHALSARKDGPFVAVNCSALSESLLESELFGHVQGAFTGAAASRAGVFESAEGGTLFLDEVGDVSPLLQLKLLRVLQEREVQRVGGDRPTPVNVRLLTATNRDLQQRVAAGTIREDFYYRIRVFDLHLPPLRERRGDIPLLAEHFARELSQVRGQAADGIASDALEALVQYPWPGNVRELRNAIEHALVVRRGSIVSLLDLPDNVREASSKPHLALGQLELTAAQEAERLRILAALDAHGWNRTKTALALGISRVTLWKKIRLYRIDEGIFKQRSRGEG